jgi:NADH:ubiquinone oxidoreductase subunit C
MLRLRASPALSFDQLQAHTALDWPSEGEIECLYLLNSTQHPQDALVSVKLSRAAPVITSVSSLWPIAEWQEREVFDMFGVLYEHHPDLRRILLDDDWLGFPLRKDYKDDFMLSRPW